MCNQKQGHEFKVKHHIWNNLILYTEVAWERVIKYVKINALKHPL